MSIRKALLVLHRYLGLLAALPLVLAALSGAVLVFEVELDHVLNPAYWKVSSAGHALPWEELVRNVRRAHPSDPATRLGSPASPTVAAEVGLKSGLFVSIDPHTGRLLGSRYPARPLMSRIHHFHTTLLMGKWGQRITGGAVIILLIVCPSGLVLWWYRRTYGIAWKSSWRRVTFDAHYVIGFFGLLPWLVLGLSGAAISFDEIVKPAIYRMTHSQPATVPPLQSVPAPHAALLTIDAAFAAANAALPGARIAYASLPQNKTGAFLFFMKFPEDHTPAGRSRVAIDQFSGRPLWVENSRTTAVGTRIWNKNRPIHTGDIFGWPSRLLACAACLALIVQIITGLWMWLARQFSRFRKRPVLTPELISRA